VAVGAAPAPTPALALLSHLGTGRDDLLARACVSDRVARPELQSVDRAALLDVYTRNDFERVTWTIQPAPTLVMLNDQNHNFVYYVKDDERGHCQRYANAVEISGTDEDGCKEVKYFGLNKSGGLTHVEEFDNFVSYTRPAANDEEDED
jgi:hypothetical protein